MVDVFATEATHQRRGQIQLFQSAVRADQRANAAGAVLRLDLVQPVGYVFQRGLPVNLCPLAALLEHGLGQALVAIQRFVRKAVAISDPAFVDRFVLERHHAHDLVVLDLDNQVGARGIVRADALAA